METSLACFPSHSILTNILFSHSPETHGVEREGRDMTRDACFVLESLPPMRWGVEDEGATLDGERAEGCFPLLVMLDCFGRC